MKKTLWAAKELVRGDEHTLCISFDESKAKKAAKGTLNHLTNSELSDTILWVDGIDITISDDDTRTADVLYRKLWEEEVDPFTTPDTSYEVRFTRSEIIKKYYSDLSKALVSHYHDVLESNGKIEYKIYIWEDGNIECLECPRGSTSRLVPNNGEKRKLFYVDTVMVDPSFDPWDCTDHSAPEDENERESERKEIYDWLEEQYEEGVDIILESEIISAEMQEDFDAYVENSNNA